MPGTIPCPPAGMKFYFAYGSNLQIKQMAARCPNSLYIGRGVLQAFRWQINQRRYANIVADAAGTVEGLVFALDGNDEAWLDVNEGIATRCYDKHYLFVTLYPAAEALYRHPTAGIAEKGGPAEVLKLAKQEDREVHEQPACHLPDVLVYLSREYVADSAPHEGYIDRINLGIADAVPLGVPQAFFDRAVRPYIPERSKQRSGQRGDED